MLQHIRRVLAGVGRNGGKIGKALLDGLALDSGLRRRVEFGDDIGRRTLRREQAVPALRLEIRKARFHRGRQFRQRGKPHIGTDDEPFHQSLVDRLRDGCRRIADAVDLAADRVGQRGRRAAIADQGDVDAGGMRKRLADQEIRRADAGMPQIDLTGIALGVSDELLQVLRRKILAQRNDAERLRHHGDWCERVRRESQLGIDGIGGRIGAGIADRDGIAVGFRARDARQRNRAAGAADILDHHGLAQR